MTHRGFSFKRLWRAAAVLGGALLLPTTTTLTTSDVLRATCRSSIAGCGRRSDSLHPRVFHAETGCAKRHATRAESETLCAPVPPPLAFCSCLPMCVRRQSAAVIAQHQRSSAAARVPCGRQAAAPRPGTPQGWGRAWCTEPARSGARGPAPGGLLVQSVRDSARHATQPACASQEPAAVQTSETACSPARHAQG